MPVLEQKKEFTCPVCKESFDTQQAVNSHKGKMHNDKVIQKCNICGREYEVVPSQADVRKTCGRDSCKNKWQSKIKSGDNNSNYKGEVCKVCKKCGEEFCGQPAYIKNREYCSVKCAHEDREQTSKITKRCKECGKTFTTWPSQDTEFCSLSCSSKFYGKKNSESMMGQNNPNWKGGSRSVDGFQVYGSNWNKQREEVIERDNGECQFCGISRRKHKDKFGTDIEVHHVVPRREFKNGTKLNWKESNKIGNLITLCKQCHRILEVGA